MKVMDTQRSPLAAQVLKLVGVVLLLSFIVELLVLLITPEFSNRQWQLGVITQLVERGVTPLVGFALIYAGFWAGASTGIPNAPQGSTWQNPKFWAFVISSLLGLLFLVLIPLHASTTAQVSQQAIDEINQQAGQVELRLEQEQTQARSLVESGQLDQLDQLVQNNRVRPEQLPLLQQLKQDPQAVDKQAEAVRRKIQAEQNQARDRTKTEALRSQLRTGLRSLLLAIGYMAIGWSGLRETK